MVIIAPFASGTNASCYNMKWMTFSFCTSRKVWHNYIADTSQLIHIDYIHIDYINSPLQFRFSFRILSKPPRTGITDNIWRHMPRTISVLFMANLANTERRFMHSGMRYKKNLIIQKPTITWRSHTSYETIFKVALREYNVRKNLDKKKGYSIIWSHLWWVGPLHSSSLLTP